jgi:hypothetical protein
MNLVHTQGADVADGAVWIATSDDHNGVYRVDLATGDTTSVGTLGHQGLEGEGIDATALSSGAFHAVINDPLGGFVFFDHYDLTNASTSAASSPTSESVSAPLGQLPATGGRWGWSWPVAGLVGLSGCAWRLRGRHP